MSAARQEDKPDDTKRRRLPPEERRRQLISIGLQELSSRPIHALSTDRVAEIAGISRGLLFRYFPTKQDFYVAIVGAAARRLLRAATPKDDSAEPLRAVLEAFVSFIDRHSSNYQAFFHSGIGGDPQIRDIHEQVRNTMVERVIAALDTSDDRTTRTKLRAWWALVESLALDRVGHGLTDRIDATVRVDDVVDYAIGLLPAVLGGTITSREAAASTPEAPRSATATAPAEESRSAAPES